MMTIGKSASLYRMKLAQTRSRCHGICLPVALLSARALTYCICSQDMSDNAAMRISVVEKPIGCKRSKTSATNA